MVNEARPSSAAYLRASKRWQTCKNAPQLFIDWGRREMITILRKGFNLAGDD
jgi:hypothetical protein